MTIARSFLLAALVALPVAAHAQAGAPAKAPTPSAPEASQPSPVEAQMRLMQAQQKALQKPEMQQELQIIDAMLKERMAKEDPSKKPQLDRLAAIKAQLDKLAAAANGQQPDATKAQPLLMEAQKLSQELASLQGKVMKLPEVSKRLDAFDAQLIKEMTALDPAVPELMAVLEAAGGGNKRN